MGGLAQCRGHAERVTKCVLLWHDVGQSIYQVCVCVCVRLSFFLFPKYALTLGILTVLVLKGP